MHDIYPVLLQHISTCVASHDSQLNKITRNMTSCLQPRHINIKPQFWSVASHSHITLSLFANRY